LTIGSPQEALTLNIIRGEFKRGFAPLSKTFPPPFIKGRGTTGEGYIGLNYFVTTFLVMICMGLLLAIT